MVPVLVNFPLLCLELQRCIAFFSRFGVGSDIGEFSSLVLGTAFCALGTDIGEFALAVPFLLFRRPLAASGGGAGGGGGGAMRRPSSSCRNNF